MGSKQIYKSEEVEVASASEGRDTGRQFNGVKPWVLMTIHKRLNKGGSSFRPPSLDTIFLGVPASSNHVAC